MINVVEPEELIYPRVIIGADDWERLTGWAFRPAQSMAALEDLSRSASMVGITPRLLAAGDDCESFDCGLAPINRWFRQHAMDDQESGAFRTYIICNGETGAIAGCVALCAAQIECAPLPQSMPGNQPDPLPAIRLGQLAVDRRYQRRGYARSLMSFVLTTAIRISKEIGCFALFTHPTNEKARVFCHRVGLEELPYDPGRAMIARIADVERSGLGAL